MKKRGKKWSDADDNFLRNNRLIMTSRQFAEHFSTPEALVSSSAIRSRCSELKIKLEKPPSRQYKYSSDQISKAREMWQEGETLSQITKRTGIRKNYVHKICTGEKRRADVRPLAAKPRKKPVLKKSHNPNQHEQLALEQRVVHYMQLAPARIQADIERYQQERAA